MKLYLKWIIFIALFSIGFLLTVYSLITSLETIDLTIWFWIGISLMSLATILIFESKKATIALFIIFLIRLVEKPIRYSNLFGVDVWYHYGVINHIISSGTLYNSIDNSITYYPTKGAHILFSILTLFKIPLVSLLKIYHVFSLFILLILLSMVSQLLLNNELFARFTLLIFILTDEIYFAYPQVAAIPIFLLSIYCVIKYFKCNDKKYLIVGFISFFSITFFHHFSTYFLVVTFLFCGILMLPYEIDKSKKLFAFSFFTTCFFILFMMIDKDLYLFTEEVFSKMIRLVVFHYTIIFFALTSLISMYFLNRFKPNFSLKINFNYIFVIAFLISIAYFSFLASGVLIRPATKTANEFLTDNIFKIFFLTISLSGILGMLQKPKGWKTLFIVGWFAAISFSSFLAIYIRVLDLVRHLSYAYLPMSISAGALISLLENRQKGKRLLTFIFLFIVIQPIIYSPLIHTQFRPGMTYELFSNETLSAAGFIKSYTLPNISIISDIRLSSLIYGYSQRNASFEWLLNSPYVFIDKPQIKYGLSSGYYGENRMLTAEEINAFHSPNYSRVYDSEEAYILLSNSEPFQIGTPYETRWSVRNIPISILLGIVGGFLLTFIIYCYKIGRRKWS